MLNDVISVRLLVLGLGGLIFLCSGVSAEVPEALVGKLADPQFDERDKAEADIADWVQEDVEGRIPDILTELERVDDPEIQARLTSILKQFSDRDYLRSGSAYLGIHMGQVVMIELDENKQAMGIPIEAVMPNSPAASVDLLPNDVIESLDGVGWNERDAAAKFASSVSAMKPLTEIELKIRRDGEVLEVRVTLGKRPIQNLAMADGRLDELDEAARERHFEKWLDQRVGVERP